MEVRQADGKLMLFEMKLDVKPKSGANSRRASDTEYFIAALNGDRLAEGKAMMTKDEVRAVCVRLSHVKTDELYPFFKRCLEYSKTKGNTFSKGFNGILKIKK